MDPDTKKQFLAAVDRLAEVDRSQHAAERTRQKLWARFELIRSQHILEIGLAKDSRGKAVYSNEDLRRASLEVRLSTDEAYQAVVSELRQVEAEIDEAVTEHNRLVDQKALLMLELGLRPPSGEEIPEI